MTPLRPRRRLTATLSLAGVCVLAAAGCGSSSSGSTSSASGGTVHLVGYSVPKPAYDALEQAFQATPAGKGVTFSSAYGPSGTESKAVSSGQPADYVVLSLDPDMTRLVPKYVASSWDANANQGIISDSVVVFVVRKGNPKHITSWADLTKPGVKIVTPDPESSGSAKWNLLAAYAQAQENGVNPSTYLTSFFKNVVAKPASGAEATTTFVQGTGDVLLSYEDQAIAARQAGDDIDYVVPKQSVLIQNPAAVTVNASAAAKRFLDFTESPAGQKIFAEKGYRPLNSATAPGVVEGANDPSNPYPAVPQLTTVASLGGWTKVNAELFSTSGLVTKIENASP